MNGSQQSLVPDGEEIPRNQVLREDVYRPMKQYFALTCQCWSIDDTTGKAKKILYRLLQFVILCAASSYFVYTLGVFGSHKKPYDLGYRFFNYPITTVENAMWEFRWLITCLLGIIFTKNIWREMFDGRLKDIKLEETRWKKVKYCSWGLALALFVMWALSVLQNFATINFKLSGLNMGLAIFLDSIMTLLDRILAFPLFFLFCVTMYILCCMVEEYRDDISNTDEAIIEDENEARKRFRKIKEAIRNTGLLFEIYLMVHFLLLVSTFFLGVCAGFEQMEVRVAENYTMPLPFEIPRSQRFIGFFGNLSTTTDYTVQVAGTSAGTSAGSARLLTPSYVVTRSQTQGTDAITGFNSTGITDKDAIRTKWLKESVLDMMLCSVVKTFESLVLYLVPVSLMVRLKNRLRRVYEVIEDSDVNEHPLFNNVEVIRRMCKYVKTAHGLKIFGYTVPNFQAFMLASFGTFFAVIIQRLLLHIHMK